MHRPDGTFWNPYDRGVLANCHMFWCRNSLPDWGVVLREERQVNLRCQVVCGFMNSPYGVEWPPPLQLLASNMYRGALV